MPMYFESRAQAGELLSDQIYTDYTGKPCAVVALSEGGVIVGAQIALKLQSVLTMLLVEQIDLPNEPDPIASLTETGSFTYNATYSSGEVDELMADYRGVVEDQKRVGMARMHHLLGESRGIRPDLLSDRHIFVVSDGFSTGFSLDIALDFLKPLRYRSLIVAAPVASPAAVDRMHVLSDKIYCLNVADSYLDTEHYYDRHDIPRREDVVRIVEEAMERWRG